MAVKPIVNPIPPGLSELDRSTQISRRNDILQTTTISNEGQTVVPGRDYNKDFQIVLKDLDTAVMTHVKNVMKLRVKDYGEMVEVPVMYANSERWAMARKKGYLRNNKGTVLLPLMLFKRTTTEFNEELPSYKHDLQHQHIEVVRSSQWSKDNQYSRFAIQTGMKPVQENIVTGVPQWVNTTYEFQVFTSYIEQMNKVVESFVQQSGTYWGDNTSYRFLCNVDGGLNDATEMTVGQDRIIKTTFSVLLKGYLLPEALVNIVVNKKANAQKKLTKSKLFFDEKVE